MTDPAVPFASVRDALARFGPLRPQPASDWTGEGPLHPTLAAFYAEVGPYGEEGPHGPDGLSIPGVGNGFYLPPLSRLWDRQAGYRWHGRTGERLAEWRDEWLMVADEGGDPFILDGTDGSILHALHGVGAWRPTAMFADVSAMAMTLAVIGTLCEEAGDELCGEDDELTPASRARLRERLAVFLGEAASDEVATRLEW